MNTNLVNIVKQIISQYGEPVLADPQRLKAFFSDLAKDEPKPLRLAFGRCIEAGAYNALKPEPDAAERAERKEAIAQRLRDEHGLDITLCGEALDILEAALIEEKTVAAVQAVSAKEGQAQDTVTNGEPQSEEISNLQKTITQKNEELIRCVRTIETLTKEKNQSDNEKQQKEDALKKTEKGLGWAIVLGIIAVVISICVGVSKYNEMEGMYFSLRSEKNKLSADYEKSKKIWAINITKLEAGNADGNNKWITKPGERLEASAIRFFNPYITVDSLISGEISLFVKIISPYGTLDRNADKSPPGYTYSKTCQVRRTNNQSIDLDGWGNADKSTYSAGEWTVEVWYEGVCLRSEKIRLN
jgi:hypothetical protein